MQNMTTERETRLKEMLLNHKARLWNELRGELFGKLGEGHHAQYETALDVGDQGLVDLMKRRRGTPMKLCVSIMT